MPSLHPGFEYDIFISYRQNDNRSGWVTEFVKALEEELSATIKDPISIYFDVNPHDGLLETHNVDKSLEGKLKCLIFIPIISQTYCDPKSFAWEHEFCAFNKLSREDQFGRDIKLGNGNVASRILPIKIHDLDTDDRATIENEIGGVLRAIEFIYKEAGVNRPLKPSDNRNENLNKTDYRNQINKTANAIKELVYSLRNSGADKKSTPTINQTQKKYSSKAKTIIALLILLSLSVVLYFIIKPQPQPKPIPRIAVLPFKTDPGSEYIGSGMKEVLIKYLRTNRRISIPPSLEATDRYLNANKSHKEIAKELNADFIIEGSARKLGDSIQLIIKLIDPTKDEILYTYDQRSVYLDLLKTMQLLAGGISKSLGTALPGDGNPLHSNNIEAIDLLLQCKELANRYRARFNDSILLAGRRLIRKSIALDPQFAEAYVELATSYLLPMTPNNPHADSIELLFNKALDIYPTYTRGINLKSQFLFFIKQDTASAFRLPQDALDQDPDNPNNIELLAWLGWLYEYWLKDGREILALPYYLKAYSLDPFYEVRGVNISTSIGMFFVHIGDYTRGEYFLKEAMRQEPNNLQLVELMGYLYRQSGQNEKLYAFIPEMEKIRLEKFPEYYGYMSWKATACLYMGRYDEGLAVIEDYFKHVKDPSFNFTYILLLEKKGFKSKAEKLIMDFIDLEMKESEPSYFALARCHARLGNKEQALKFLDKVPFTHTNQQRNPGFFSNDLMLESLWNEPAFVNRIQKEEERLKGIRERLAIMEKEKLIVIPQFIRNN